MRNPFKRKDEWSDWQKETMRSMFDHGFCDSDIAIVISRSIKAVVNQRNRCELLRTAGHVHRWSTARLRQGDFT